MWNVQDSDGYEDRMKRAGRAAEKLKIRLVKEPHEDQFWIVRLRDNRRLNESTFTLKQVEEYLRRGP